ncbi:hypothetical protein LEP1GSC016_1774 [Leptospira borgpetersenii serovar Hardjo-bovis str. Sponselee]|uniref:Uncharacterized protein n=6 Tax=Leptospira borgpetersenii TaxID=174 RepID=M3HNV8_LEPBO|nr:hypothetical protein LEP1GSC128_3381 [Leptospira borgpetersenii str. 200801926]EKQ92163.1 hypothetical protein LEP1GSC101_3107 [Leptospira borgpetersenii str. UI 09149]EMF99344.1 hypothetical protein LEP1GSC123_4729 [Leptospira borgpetersenii str. 200701203]EMJ80295.1 hypothetical protein LEP1GSC016_1774 [Leptospira borgpetersenii serovar Hardjo-bovis str. Sponselee]EMK13313.1 hypothetical protein LEP1GSC066_3836 [Leptospira sp. serovar Kenya str. Sh9]EMN14109.1 hypothetical protein LEP1GSC
MLEAVIQFFRDKIRKVLFFSVSEEFFPDFDSLSFEINF